MNRTMIIARHEFLSNVKRKEFIFMTIGMPLIVVVIISVPLLLAGLTLSKNQEIGYIDYTTSFDFPAIISPNKEKIEKIEKIDQYSLMKNVPEDRTGLPTYKFIRYDNEDTIRKDLVKEKISSYFIIPEDYLETGEIRFYSIGMGFPGASNGMITDVLIGNLLNGKVDEKILERVKDPVNIIPVRLNKKGEVVEKGVLSFLIPIVFAFILIMAIFMSSGFLLQGIVEEKESRIIEVLLSSVSPQELMTGKILGLGAVGMTQVLVWLVIGIMPASFILATLSVPLSTVVLVFVYFIFGYLLYASIILGIGAITSSLHEGQQLTAILSLITTTPLILSPILFENPDSTFARALSYFPLTSPIAMMVRTTVEDIPLLEVILSLVILVASTYLTIKVSTKVFHMGLLMYGKRPAFKEIVRYLRGA